MMVLPVSVLTKICMVYAVLFVSCLAAAVASFIAPLFPSNLVVIMHLENFGRNPEKGSLEISLVRCTSEGPIRTRDIWRRRLNARNIMSMLSN